MKSAGPPKPVDHVRNLSNSHSSGAVAMKSAWLPVAIEAPRRLDRGQSIGRAQLDPLDGPNLALEAMPVKGNPDLAGEPATESRNCARGCCHQGSSLSGRRFNSP
jgi:hypothetical protein